MSLGAGGCDRSEGGVLYKAIIDALAANIAVVVAAGNNEADASGLQPACYPEVITVDAIDIENSAANWSNYGDVVDMFAPGLNNTINGSSMATPHVAGLAAYMINL